MRQAFIHGNVYTMQPVSEADPSHYQSILRPEDMIRASAFGVEDGCFAIVGDDVSVLAWAADGAADPADVTDPGNMRIVDLEGRCILPGFNDSHCHLLATGLGENQLDLRGVSCCEEIIERGRAYLAVHPLPPGAWLYGYGFDNNGFPDGKMPDQSVADAICSDRPVMLDRICGHVGTVNQAALTAAGFDEHTVLTGGVLDKDAQGHLTGVLREVALDVMRRVKPLSRGQELRDALIQAMALANRYGVTSVQTDDLESAQLDDVLDLYESMVKDGAMTVRVYEEIQQPRMPELTAFLQRGLRTGDGNAFFRIGNIKILTDGSLGGRTAYLSGPYTDAPETSGVAVYTQEALNEVVDAAVGAGMQCAFHAIGDGASAQAVRAVELAQAHYPGKMLRHRIVHCQFASEETLKRMAAAGMCADIQPAFVGDDYPIVRDRVGEDRETWSYTWRTNDQMGIPQGGGSDSPVVTMNPLRGIDCAVNRTDEAGLPAGGWHPEEKMSVAQAVSLYTIGGAWVSHSEHEKGRIREGMLADFTALDRDIFMVPESEIGRIRVVGTWIGGKKCFEDHG